MFTFDIMILFCHPQCGRTKRTIAGRCQTSDRRESGFTFLHEDQHTPICASYLGNAHP